MNESDVFLPMLLATQTSGTATDATTPLRFHQGVVIAWNVVAGTNTVRINGNDFTDLRTIMGPEAGLIRAGDTVAVLAHQTAYFVLGRVSAAGGDQRALGMANAAVFASETHSSSTYADLATPGPTVTVYIGSTRRALVWISALAVSNGMGSGALMGVEVTGDSTIAATALNQAANTIASGGITVSAPIAVTQANGLNQGFNTFTAKYRNLATMPQVSGTWSNRQLIVMPF